jgi:acyl-coenzyme A thioesterase PaaI-like protein
MSQLHDADTADAVPTDAEEAAPPQMFVNDLSFGFDLAADGMSVVGDATITDALRSVGSELPRASVLATMADCMAGLAAFAVTAPRLAVTLDIVVRNVATRCGDRLDVAGEIVKKGRSTIASEVRFSDSDTKDLVALSYLTFMTSPRPQDQAPAPSRGMRTTGSMPNHFAEHVGLRTIEAGVVEVNLVPFVMQASRTLQGGVVGLLGEVAAESLTSAPILELDVRYLNAIRVGPARATATQIGQDLVRVEVRDRGIDDRLATLILVRFAPA